MTGMSYWVICLAAFLEWEASAWRDSSWPWHPSFTNLIDPLLTPHLIESAAFLVWLLAGWALVQAVACPRSPLAPSPSSVSPC